MFGVTGEDLCERGDVIRGQAIDGRGVASQFCLRATTRSLPEGSCPQSNVGQALRAKQAPLSHGDEDAAGRLPNSRAASP